jgi:hypothetical protein
MAIRSNRYIYNNNINNNTKQLLCSTPWQKIPNIYDSAENIKYYLRK